jgi:hypothetical protein
MAATYLQECANPSCYRGKRGRKAKLPINVMVLAANHMYMCAPCARETAERQGND